ncbi:flavin-containing monooxygenase [Microcella pacifica]|uniref:NAD(P)/FAD-dependent oxidoreductase n=1 Tax=Microcella pacifica TaxID=2591847 RepID=A0A9E5MI00_9MICO|nr:NAD(P)/FAD-dependent oxidoreductase [Microcella pacifica]NHF62163.1 NAD(P)/FAD-dependent oxidoreductase [Microcella pacifica]
MSTAPVDLVIIGAGFAGIYTTLHAQRRGLTTVGIDAASDVGGTWYWNRYPGARCDVESLDYSYSFDDDLQREWRWSERYATQPEILRYLEHVADRYDVRQHYRFGERMLSADWSETTHTWTVRTDAGSVVESRWLVMATGSLSAPILPDLPGRDTFRGEVYQTAAWPIEHPDLRGKRIALIGTGSSGIQALPHLAAAGSEVVVYQRTANYSVPAFNRNIDDDEWLAALADYPERRRASWNSLAGSPWTSHPVPFHEASPDEREAVFEEFWTRGGVLFAKAFQGLTGDAEINAAATEFFERQLATLVDDPHTLADLTPHDHPLGTKRICTDSGYYQTFNQEHVHLVNLQREPITAVSERGITTSSTFREHDVIVYATGFDAMTGALTEADIRGRDGRLLRDEWKGGPTTLLGIGIPGFPNLLSLNGPGSPSVLSNMALCSEQQGDFALRLIDHCAQTGFTSAEARWDAALEWTEHGRELASRSFFGSTRSWYTGANVEGKARGFLPYIGGFRPYIERCDDVAGAGYAGFVLSEH